MIQYLHTDNIGSVRLITDSTGVVVGAADYSPYGAVAARTGTATSSFGFATAWADPDTHFNYLRARDYDPATGQFLQVDPVVDVTHQPYAYVAGDPLASIDPLGLCVGLDGTPQDRNCTQNDYFWAGLPGAIYDQLIVATAGFNDGMTYGTSLLANEAPKPPGFDPKTWQWREGSRLNVPRSWWDPDGGEWRYHPEDKWHDPHWDHNPWDDWNSPWQY